MTPHSAGRRAYWHAGGALESRPGTITRHRALQLFSFYAGEAICSAANDDIDAFAFCARTSLELADALCDLESWGHAASALPSGCEARVWRENSRTWLTNAARVKKLLNYLDRLGSS